MLYQTRNEYNCLPRIMQVKLYIPLETGMSHKIQLYPPLLYLNCNLITSGSRFNIAKDKQRKQSSGILKQNEE